MPDTLRHTDLYRVPWTLPDNAINWLEPTSMCNLYCDGCYRKNVKDSHKPLDLVRRELDTFNRLRKTDGVSISGGDPLTHPGIERIVEMVAADGQKPIINTNGQLLTPEKLASLKRAGVAGFTFHIDSGQNRPHMKGKTEIELNELRLHYAEMLAAEGGISCAFNATVYEDTLKDVPELLAWAQAHIDIVNIMVFIAYRAAPIRKGWEYYVGGEKIDMGPIAYAIDEERNTSIMSTDVVEVIRTRYPDFQPCAYLNGTERPDHFKWLFTLRLGTKDRIYGYAGPKLMEISQALHHLTRGTYLAYTSPKVLGRGRSLLLLSPVDKGLARTASAYLHGILRSPSTLFRKLHMQSVMIIQPADLMRNGALSMCDGCPDITVFEDRLVWSCRMEELSTFGDWVRPVPGDGGAAGTKEA
ncbi:MAG: putative Fe-S oxidoreductase [Acidobacteria bacterium]|nr:putative Fe-S oxidoreductase [Acidobacteriota bacterium]